MRDKLIPMGFAAVPTLITKIWDNFFDMMDWPDDDLLEMRSMMDKFGLGLSDKQCIIRKKDDKIVMEVKVPGAKKDDISISLKDNVLTVKAETKQEKSSEDDDEGEYYSFRAVKFYRQLTLPKNADTDNITATLSDGILSVIVPLTKEESETGRNILIQ